MPNEVPTPDEIVAAQKCFFQDRVDALVKYLFEQLKVQRASGLFIGEAEFFEKDTLVVEAAIRCFEEKGWRVKVHRPLFKGGPSLKFYRRGAESLAQSRQSSDGQVGTFQPL